MIETEVAKLVPPDAEPGDCFGSRVAIFYDTIVAAAPWDTIEPGIEQAGSVYVYSGFGSHWELESKLVAFDAAHDDNFGFSVAIWADTIAVGAEHVDHHGRIDAGAVYLYRKVGDFWYFTQRVVASDPQDEDHFGHSVALFEDYLVVGTYGSDKAYVFTRHGTTWREDQALGQHSHDGSNFGQSVAVSGEILAVGADWYRNTGTPSGGAVFVYALDGGSWKSHQKIVASDGREDDHFGYAISLHGNTLIVGANGHDNGSIIESGAAYLFNRVDDHWVQGQKLAPKMLEMGQHFGSTVAAGENQLLVGSPFGMSPDGARCGCTHVYTHASMQWSESCVLMSSDRTHHQRFGVVATHRGTSVLGAPFSPYGCNEIGAAYVYYVNEGSPSFQWVDDR